MHSYKNVKLLALFNFLLDFRLYSPVAILYFSQITGSYALGMSVFSVIMLSSALLEVPTGIFSDMIGRKKTAVLGACASTVAVIAYAVGGTYIVLLIGAFFEGLSRAFFSGNNDALLHDTLTETGQEASYQEFLGKVSSMYQAALAISAMLGSIVASVSFSLVMWLSVIPQVLGIIVTLNLVEPKIHGSESGNVFRHLNQAFQNFLHNRRLRSLSIASIFAYAIGESAFHFRATFIQTVWPLWAIGFARTISNICAAVSFYLAGKTIRRFGEYRLLIGGITISELMNLFAIVIPTIFSPVIQGFTSLFFGVNMVSINGLMQREFTPQQRATMGSLNAFGGNLAFAVYSVLMGFIADRVGVIPALVISTLLMIIPLWFFRQAFRSKGKHESISGELSLNNEAL